MPLSFKKEERLCSRRQIEQLYSEGHRLRAFPFSVQWMTTEQPSLCQVMIVAPKRKFKHAVDRNRVKRLTRECYRQRKDVLYGFLQEHHLRLALSLVYIHNEILTCEQLGHKMDKLLAALEKEILSNCVS